MTEIGVLAGLLTTCAWLPQLRRSWQTRSTGDISWTYLAAFGTGVALWLVYGVLEGDLPIVLANVATAAAVAFLIALKVRFDRLRGREAQFHVDDGSARALDGIVVPGGLDAVLLDMDGTLVDSGAAVERAWMRWAAEYGVEAGVLVDQMHGRPAHATVRAVAPDLDETQVAVAGSRQITLQYDDLDDVAPACGAAGLVAWLTTHGVPWAVVTMADRRLALARLTAAGITAPLVVTVEDVTAGKPDPEGYLLAARTLGVDARRCLVVEDSETGATAGRRSGAVVAGLGGVPSDIAIGDLGDVVTVLEYAFR